MAFLDDLDLRPFALTEAVGFRPRGLALGQGSGVVFEVAVLEPVTGARPTQQTLKAAWRARVAGRAAPVLLVALHNGKASLCGPTGENPPVLLDQDAEQVEKLCRAALSEPDRHAAVRFLQSALPTLGTPLVGVRNEGLLASHALHEWGRQRAESAAKGRPALQKRGVDLMKALGFEVQPLAGPVSVLLAGPRKVAVAAFLDRGEAPDVASMRFSNFSPASYALTRAGDEGLSWVVVAAGPAVRLYPVQPDVGVGRRGRTETFVELQLGLLREDQAAYLWDLFSAEALTPDGSIQRLLDESDRYGSDLGTRLRKRVYDEAVPALATALARARNLASPDREQLDETYQMALVVLFRLLFVAYAEDRDLLPYKSNDLYRDRSLKHKARELAQLAERMVPFDLSTSHWDETLRVFRAVDHGSAEWGVPAYNGGLFSEDAAVSPLGAALPKLTLSNQDFGPVLRAVLVDETPDGFTPVDFRSLGVRHFGTIYEGLLESELSVAETDLDVDERGSYIPTKLAEPKVRRGDIYLHNRSGSRKATGSYFTKAFAVDHLLDHALEPALDEHLARLDALPDEEAGEAFFDFRVADIAMGSGHFLVAALDRMERRLADYLTRRPLPAVRDELSRLRAAVATAMGSLPDPIEVEDAQLLRRQIARRCIYGVDLNPLAVELARLSLWVHTFVPGLPLSLLDAHLVRGNSLVGIGTLDEARTLVEAATGGPLFGHLANDLMDSAAKLMARVGRLADADAAEIDTARGALQQAREAGAPLAAMLDILAASRLDAAVTVHTGVLREWAEQPEQVPGSPLHERAYEAMKAVPPFHFPIAFSDVFQRQRAGFDVIIGNPPWEEATVEEHAFWARHFPGLRGVSQNEREGRIQELRAQRADLVAALGGEIGRMDLLRRVLTTGPYPGMGSGDPDLYKAFCWRFWHLACPGGRIGVVLPRSVWNAKGSGQFRERVFTGGKVGDLTFLLNSAGWVFDDAEPRYTIALSSIGKAEISNGTLPLRGPYRNLASFAEGVKQEPVRFPVDDVLGWTDTAALPLLPSEASAEVFAQLRKAPRLDLDDVSFWRARPYAELHATHDKPLMTFGTSQPSGYWPVYSGESFDIWEADRGPSRYYAWIDAELAIKHLETKRARAAKGRGSPFSEFGKDWLNDPHTLPCLRPRIAFRDVARATDSRTIRAALVPPHVAITNKGPYFLWPRGDERDQAFLLGVLSSIPLDWYARRFVETTLNYHILNPFPIPRPPRTNPLWERTVALAGRLACPEDRFAEWAEAVGVACGPLEPAEKSDMIHELDAVVAHLYGLSEGQLCHIFETFHEGWQYGPRLEATLKHFRAWSSRR